MKNNSLLKAAAALSMMVILSSCAASPGLQLQFRSADQKGKADAGVTVAKQPAGCAIDTPHAALTTGEDVRVLLRRERGQLDSANGKRSDCYLFNKVQMDVLRGAAGK